MNNSTSLHFDYSKIFAPVVHNFMVAVIYMLGCGFGAAMLVRLVLMCLPRPFRGIFVSLAGAAGVAIGFWLFFQGTYGHHI